MSGRTVPEWLQGFLSNPSDDLGNAIMDGLRDPRSKLTRDLQAAAEEGLLGPEGERLHHAVLMMQLWGGHDKIATNGDLRTLRAQIAMNTVTGSHPVFEDDMGKGIQNYRFPTELHAVAALTDVMEGHGGRALRTIMERRLPPWARHRGAVGPTSSELRGIVPQQRTLASPPDTEPSRLTRRILVDPNQLGRQSLQMMAGLQTAALTVEQSLTDANVLEKAQALMAQALQGISGVLHGLTAQDHDLLRHAMGERHARLSITTEQARRMGIEVGQRMAMKEAIGETQIAMLQGNLAQMEQGEARSMALTIEEHGPSNPIPPFERSFDVSLPSIEVRAARGAGFATGTGGRYEERADGDSIVIDAWAGKDGAAGGVIGVDRVSVGQATIHTAVSFSSGR